MAHTTQPHPNRLPNGAGVLFALAFGLAACGGSSYPPAPSCARCDDTSASGALRAEVLTAEATRKRAGARSSETAEPRNQRAFTQSQVASTSVTIPLPTEPGVRVRARSDRAAAASTARRIGPPVTLVYAPSAEQLTLEMKNQLRILALELRRNDDLRVELQAYASLPERNASHARHLALNRAMAVRAYLIEQDVDLDQMDVRALGDRATGGPADRVDIVAAASRRS